MAQCELFLCVDNAKVARLCIGLALEAGLQAGIRGECMLPHKRKTPESNRRRASFCLHCEILVICMLLSTDIVMHIVIIIIITTVFMALSSWKSHCDSSPGSFDECRMAPSPKADTHFTVPQRVEG